MKLYLIDYENVKKLDGIGELADTDKVWIFYTKNSDSITFKALEEIRNTKANVEIVGVATGKNALDFQLSSFLGYLMNDIEGKDIYIISKDKGYEAVVDFWTARKGAVIHLAPSIKEQEIKISPANSENTPKKSVSEPVSQDLRQTLVKSNLTLSKDDINAIIRVISQFKTKTAINNNLNKHFKESDRVGKILKVVNPFIKNKK